VLVICSNITAIDRLILYTDFSIKLILIDRSFWQFIYSTVPHLNAVFLFAINVTISVLFSRSYNKVSAHK
jgi:hypothetical protein